MIVPAYDIPPSKVFDLTPLAALTALRSLLCRGTRV